MTVRVLDDRVVDQIAAGEVVERPASIVKELVENALDAGATRVGVRLKAGGVARVEVVDDGCGMSRADAVLCVERHATSKIRRAEDLVGVVTFGFRGEALAAIGSVAELRIRTRREEDAVGTEVRMEGGRLVSVNEVATPRGTEMVAASLFASIPARRRFLRSKQTELDHAAEAVRRAMLARPDVAVSLSHDGHELFRSAEGTLEARARDLLGDDADALVAIEHLRGAVRVSGLVSPPHVHRAATASASYAYVNGRFVRDPVVRRALTEAWRGALPPGRAPVSVLFVEVPGEDVDVNVHPQKTEVRFQDARAVSEAVTEGVRDALRRAASAPRGAAGGRGPRPSSAVSAMPETWPSLFPAGAAGSDPASTSAPPDAPEPPAVGIPTRRAVAPPAPIAPEGDASSPIPATPPATPPAAPPATPPATPPAAPAAAPAPRADGMDVSEASKEVVDVDPSSDGPAPLAASPEARWRTRRLVGVHSGRYALVEEAGDLLVVDLDALRRADLAADLAARAREGEISARPRLVPARVELTRLEASVLLAAAEALSAHGVELHPLGPGVLALVGAPAGVEVTPGELLRALAARPDAPARVLSELTALPPADEPLARSLLARLDEQEVEGGPPVVRIPASALRGGR